MMAVDRTPLSTPVRRIISAAGRMSTAFSRSVYAIFYSGVSGKNLTGSAAYYPVYSVYTYKCRKGGKWNKGIYRGERSQAWTPQIVRSA